MWRLWPHAVGAVARGIVTAGVVDEETGEVGEVGEITLVVDILEYCVIVIWIDRSSRWTITQKLWIITRMARRWAHSRTKNISSVSERVSE
jgi:hypothetical protein